MNINKVIIGIILVLVGLFFLIYFQHPVLKFIGAGVIAVLGLATIFTAYKKDE